MILLDYHKNIDDYVLSIFMYQVCVKPIISKTVFISYKERLRFISLISIIFLSSIVYRIASIIKTYGQH